MCVELGLHRQKRSSRISFKSELNKRLFWSAYFSEREIAIAMGRPPSISDHDIDVDVRNPCLFLFLNVKIFISERVRTSVGKFFFESVIELDILKIEIAFWFVTSKNTCVTSLSHLETDHCVPVSRVSVFSKDKSIG